jgi:hypothetical protein
MHAHHRRSSFSPSSSSTSMWHDTAPSSTATACHCRRAQGCRGGLIPVAAPPHGGHLPQPRRPPGWDPGPTCGQRRALSRAKLYFVRKRQLHVGESSSSSARRAWVPPQRTAWLGEVAELLILLLLLRRWSSSSSSLSLPSPTMMSIPERATGSTPEACSPPTPARGSPATGCPQHPRLTHRIHTRGDGNEAASIAGR